MPCTHTTQVGRKCYLFLALMPVRQSYLLTYLERGSFVAAKLGIALVPKEFVIHKFGGLDIEN